ncbi:MAG: bifunctional adenosylcobinamide kinase/adenosylcobinamide-phosphate guanylyltransferase [Maritimibacter sp.]|nr:bifunctional adenosylcobinamide kinase/adenosylcobinamide-phosphate guanylyltransferase [Maritimibacter sp.]
MTAALPPLTLVIGAAASGKSAFAERLITATGAPALYIATAEAHDAEMRAKIAAHRARRGAGWTTVEAARDLAPPLAAARPHQPVLLDCATLWLTNQLLAEADLAAEQSHLLQSLAACPAPVIIVTNEVGAGLVPETTLGRRFRDAQGRLNQALAAQADLVVLVSAGLPLVLKGHLPGTAP